MPIDECDFARAILLLDGSIEALDAAAKREMRREAGKQLRCITEQERAKTARKFIGEIRDKYDFLG